LGLGISAGINLLYGSTFSPISKNWKALGTNPVYGDPRFLNPAGGNYNLGPGSAAIDTGVTEPTITKDIDGDPRPIGAGYDIGADEARFVYLPLVLRNYSP
jgi:hypothetical protein